MCAYVEASRALAYYAAAEYDAQHASPDEADRKGSQAIYEFLVPIVKGFSTEMSIDVASLGVGGMGFIEETGAAQHYRDGGSITQVLFGKMKATEQDRASTGSADAKAVLRQLTPALEAFEASVAYILANAKTAVKAVYAGSFAYLRLCGLVLSAWQMARALLVAEGLRAGDPGFYDAKIATARFFAENLLPQAQALATSILEGGHSTNALEVEQF